MLIPRRSNIMEVIPDKWKLIIPIPCTIAVLVYFAESGAETAYEWYSILGVYLILTFAFYFLLAVISTIHDVYLMYRPPVSKEDKEKYKEKPSPWY